MVNPVNRFHDLGDFETEHPYIVVVPILPAECKQFGEVWVPFRGSPTGHSRDVYSGNH